MAGRSALASRTAVPHTAARLPRRRSLASPPCALLGPRADRPYVAPVGETLGAGILAGWAALIPLDALADTVAASEAATPRSAGLGEYALALTPIVLYGIFNVMRDTFASKETASASHILVPDVGTAQALKDKLDGAPKEALPALFAELAKENSICPSAANGGSLGTFRPGQMVPQFDRVVFNPDRALGEVHGPVTTSFGQHLILMTARVDKEGNAEQ